VSETKTMFKERVPGVLKYTSSTSCDSVAKRWTRLDNINVLHLTHSMMKPEVVSRGK